MLLPDRWTAELWQLIHWWPSWLQLSGRGRVAQNTRKAEHTMCASSWSKYGRIGTGNGSSTSWFVIRIPPDDYNRVKLDRKYWLWRLAAMHCCMLQDIYTGYVSRFWRCIALLSISLARALVPVTVCSQETWLGNTWLPKMKLSAWKGSSERSTYQFHQFSRSWTSSCSSGWSKKFKMVS